MALTLEKIAEINSAVNAEGRYRTDLEQYGVVELWSDLRTVQGADGKVVFVGDCEDFCMSKLHALLKAGADITDCKFVLVNSAGTKDVAYGHCALKVKDCDGKEWMLDQRYPDRGLIALDMYPDQIYGWGMGMKFSKVEIA